MNNQFKLILFTIILLAFITPTISARSFSVSSVDINYTLNQNGIVNVSEKWDYDLVGCYKELYIQKPNDLVILNPSGYCTGSSCEFIYKPTDTVSGEKELILRGDYCDTSVTAYFYYTVDNQISALADGVQFYYKLYGENTTVPTNTNITLFLPGGANLTTPLIHSKEYNLITDKNLIVISKSVYANEIIEINLLMPKNWFDTTLPNFYNSEYTNYTISQIKEIDQTWEDDYDRYASSIKPTPVYVFILVILFPILIIFLIWLIFGREYSRKKVGYFGIFERDLPGDEDPVKANYFITGEFSKDWFSSGIMYLVWKKNFELIKKADDEFILIKTKKEIDKNILPDYVFDIYTFLIENYPNGEINLGDLKDRLSGKISSFKNMFSNLQKNAELQKDFLKLHKSTKEKCDSWFKKSNLFKSTGYKLVSVISVILFVFLFIISSILGVGGFTTFIVFVIYFLIIFLSKFFFYKIIFGKFTMKGRIKNLKWEAFKKYITTFSYMKEHPPASVIIWEEYMVYATAFGVAKKTSKALKMILPDELNHNDKFIAYAGFAAFSPSFSASTGGSSGSHGGGGFGGGGGGGGGGAR